MAPKNIEIGISDKIMDYFGVKISMYFSYLGHYTRALTLPAFIGFMIWMMEGRNQVGAVNTASWSTRTWPEWQTVLMFMNELIQLCHEWFCLGVSMRR